MIHHAMNLVTVTAGQNTEQDWKTSDKTNPTLQKQVDAAYRRGGHGRDSLVYSIAVHLFDERLQKHGAWF
jgi:hypothetical protein